MAESTWREAKKALTRQRIVAESVRLFCERGYAQTSMGQIAEAAAVSVATVYNYFPAKQDILFADGQRWEHVPSCLLHPPAGLSIRQLLLQAFEEFLDGDWLIPASDPRTAAAFHVVLTTAELYAGYHQRMVCLQQSWMECLSADYLQASVVALLGGMWGAVEATVRQHQGQHQDGDGDLRMQLLEAVKLILQA